MSRRAPDVRQLVIDFSAPPPPPPVVAVESAPPPPPRPSWLDVARQQAVTDRRTKALDAKLRAVPAKVRRRWDAVDGSGVVVATWIERLIADVPDLYVAARFDRVPSYDQQETAMRTADVSHGSCLLRRCARTGQLALLADRSVTARFEAMLR